MASQERDMLAALPFEILEDILSYLPLRSFAHLRRTSRSIKEVAESDAIWEKAVVNTFGLRFKTLCSSYKPFSVYLALCYTRKLKYKKEPNVDGTLQFIKDMNAFHFRSEDRHTNNRLTASELDGLPIDIERPIKLFGTPTGLSHITSKGTLKREVYTIMTELQPGPTYQT